MIGIFKVKMPDGSFNKIVATQSFVEYRFPNNWEFVEWLEEENEGE